LLPMAINGLSKLNFAFKIISVTIITIERSNNREIMNNRVTYIYISSY